MIALRIGSHRKTVYRVCIFLTICILLCINASAESGLHWYCKRNKDHKQPTLDYALSCIDEYRGVYVDKAHHDQSDDKVIYLTFDVGYENGNVEKILDILKDEDVQGAFFILGNVISRNPELIIRMENEGHLVCNHTYTHKNVTKMDEKSLTDELVRLEQAYQNLTQKQLDKYFRPPEGTFDSESLKTVCENGYTTVFWSFAYADWDNNKQMSAQKAKQIILENLHNGEVMLLHPTSNTNVAILADVICEIRAMGYRFGTLDDLTGADAE